MGDAYQEREMVNAVIHNNYNVEAALDTLLNKSIQPQTNIYSIHATISIRFIAKEFQITVIWIVHWSINTPILTL